MPWRLRRYEEWPSDVIIILVFRANAHITRWYLSSQVHQLIPTTASSLSIDCSSVSCTAKPSSHFQQSLLPRACFLLGLFSFLLAFQLVSSRYGHSQYHFISMLIRWIKMQFSIFCPWLPRNCPFMIIEYPQHTQASKKEGSDPLITFSWGKSWGNLMPSIL
jgi:hypothetical protein